MANEGSGGDLPGAIGLLCGAGNLPLRVAETLTRQGIRVTAIGIEGEADPALSDLADEIHWTGLAKLARWIRLFKAAGVDAVLMCGGVQKRRMFGNVAAMMPDWRSMKLWYQRLKSKEDHTILAALADEFEKENLPVRSVVDYCPDLLAARGCVTERRPDPKQWRDICFGWPIAKQVAALQVGQCIVVKDQTVIAVEGIDGTNATLERGGKLAGAGAVALKVAKEGHDMRFDIPCIGPKTVETLRGSGIAVLVIEAARSILLDRDAVKQEADEAGLCVVALTVEDVADAS